jgi:hypothetical protein
MGYIAFSSAKGSPGVTTAVAALAATWPADRALVVVELDPAGGDLVVRFDLATEPGLVTLAAAGRRDLGAETLLAHTQVLPRRGEAAGGDATRRVLTAPVSADQATAALTALRGGLPRTLDALDADVIVDCGRLDPTSPAYDVAAGAQLLVMVTRPVVAEVHHLGARLAALASIPAAVVTVGDRPYPVAEVAEAVGAHPLGTLAVDGRPAAALSGDLANAERVLRRSRLLRDAGAMAEALAGWLGPGTAPGGSAVRPGSAVGGASVEPESVGSGSVGPAASVDPASAGPASVRPGSAIGPASVGPGSSVGPASVRPGSAVGSAAPVPAAPVRPPGPPAAAGRAPAAPATTPARRPVPEYRPPLPPPPHGGSHSAAPVPQQPGPRAPRPDPPRGDRPTAAPPTEPQPEPRGSGRNRGRNGAAPKHFRRDPVEEPRR